MTTNTEMMSWSFGGALAGLAPATAWWVLGILAVAGIGFVTWSYHAALIAIEPGRRAALCALRSLVWLALLVVLAAPTRIKRTYEQPPTRPLAVLVDRSGSMTAPDNRQRRRLDDAVRRWRELEPAGRAAFGAPKVFEFADGVKPTAAVDSARAVAPEQTKLFAALQQVLAQAPPGGWAGVVTLTDGLDTSGTVAAAGLDATARAASAGSTPLFFVPGRNRYAGDAFFGLREFNVPGRTMPRSTIRVEATFDSFQPAKRDVSVQFKVNGVARPAPPLHVEAGRRLTAWSAEVAADGPGVLDLELRVGDEIARAAVRVELPPSNRILYYQGALDWSYRFLADILKRDATFVLTPVFNFPNPDAVLPPGALRRMPEIPKQLDGFEIVILANASAAQFTPAQQAALGTWVRDGGVLLFFTPDDDSTQGFAGSELEKMLPVVFAAPSRGRPGAQASRVLSALRGGSGAADPTRLVAFEWEQTSRAKEIFAEAEKKNATLVSPLFSEYAHVAHAKPGADVLARHPTERSGDSGEKAILLATQRYGRGQSGVLTTDALWRWKLNQPASERGAEIFWQNLFAWLTRERQQGLRFDQPPRVAEVARDLAFRLLDAGAERLKVEATLGSQRVTLSEGPADEAARVFKWRPPTEGFWQITATNVAGQDARHWLSVKKGAITGELSGAAPDEELLRDLANRTGGAVLENAPPAAWQPPGGTRGELQAERREALWHRPWIFGAMLGAYGLEMLLRRKWRLL